MTHPTEIPVTAEIMSRECAAQLLGEWAIRPDVFEQMYRQVASLDITAYLNARAAAAKEAKAEGATETRVLYSRVGRVAVVPIKGAITKEAHSFQAMFGGTASSVTRQAIQTALNDDQVGAILLHIDSPGGTVRGTGDLADDIMKAREKKPVVTFAEDGIFSAAYWIGSQANHIFASPNAFVGSIGVILQLVDSSKRFEKEGLRAVVLTTGPDKGIGAEGAPITEAHEKKLQEHIDGINAQFVAAVARGRGLTAADIKPSNTGWFWPAAEAKERKLIDSIGTFQDAHTFAANLAGQSSVQAKIARVQSAAAQDVVLESNSAGPASEASEAGLSTEAAAPSEAPGAADPKQPEQGDISPVQDAPASDAIPAASSGENESSPAEAPQQPRELRQPDVTDMTPEEVQALIASGVEKALNERDAKASASALAAKRTQMAQEFGMSEAELALFPTVEALDAVANYKREARDGGAEPLSTVGFGKQSKADETPAFDVGAEYEKAGNPNVISGISHGADA